MNQTQIDVTHISLSRISLHRPGKELLARNKRTRRSVCTRSHEREPAVEQSCYRTDAGQRAYRHLRYGRIYDPPSRFASPEDSHKASARRKAAPRDKSRVLRRAGVQLLAALQQAICATGDDFDG